MVSNGASIAALATVLAVSSSETEDLKLTEVAEGPAQGETQELTQPPEDFFTKPFDDYTVTEGLLFCIFVALVCSFLGRFLGRCTSWL